MAKLTLFQPYLLAAAAAALSLWLCLVVKAGIRRAAERRDEDKKDILEACRKIQETIDEMRRQPAAQAAPVAADLPVAGPAATMSRRAQILRMARRGDRPEQIAAALAMPLHEVTLVLKMASLQQASAATA